MWSKLKELKDLDKDDVLEVLGLQSRRTAVDYLLPAVGIFSVGVLVGAGIGLLLAPKPGAELRHDLRERLTGGPDQLKGQFPPEARAPSPLGRGPG
ncbi:MAG: YtxH domain-containing protein [Myxococcota bacterium]